MTTTLKQANPELANGYVLTQAAYHAVVRGVDIALKLSPVAAKPSLQHVFFYDSVLRAAIICENDHGRYVRAMIQADYTPLLGQKVTLAFATDKAAIEKAKAIRGVGDVRVGWQDGQYHIKGDHTGTRFQAIPMPDPACGTPLIPTWLGAEVAGYDPKDLSAYIGKKNKAVHLAVYGDQLEQVWVEGQDDPYTFTPAMVERLVDCHTDVELKSQIAFRFVGPKQTLRLGKVNGQYVLCVTNAIDLGVDLVVTEVLDAVAGN